MLLSHAHIDHSGNLPQLIMKRLSWPDLCTTAATAHLANLMLIDSGHIHESDAEYLQQETQPAKAMKHPIEPLYTIEDAAQVAQYFESQPV